MRKLVFLFVAALFLVPGAAMADFNTGDKVFTLGGSGSSDNDFDTTDINLEGSYGVFFSPMLEGLVRQTLSYTARDDADDDWRASTGVAADWHFNLMNWQPFLGAGIGYNYGDGDDSFFAGPEAGVKAFVTDTAFVQFLAQYQWFFDEIGEADEGTDDGQFFYSLGLGVKF